MSDETGSGCAARHPVTNGRCQLPADHPAEHVFPIDDEFIKAFEDGLLVIGRRSKKS